MRQTRIIGSQSVSSIRAKLSVGRKFRKLNAASRWRVASSMTLPLGHVSSWGSLEDSASEALLQLQSARYVELTTQNATTFLVWSTTEGYASIPSSRWILPRSA